MIINMCDMEQSRGIKACFSEIVINHKWKASRLKRADMQNWVILQNEKKHHLTTWRRFASLLKAKYSKTKQIPDWREMKRQEKSLFFPFMPFGWLFVGCSSFFSRRLPQLWNVVMKKFFMQIFFFRLTWENCTHYKWLSHSFNADASSWENALNIFCARTVAIWMAKKATIAVKGKFHDYWQFVSFLGWLGRNR